MPLPFVRGDRVKGEAWNVFSANSNIHMIVRKDLKYFWFLFTKWRDRARLMYFCVFREYAYTLSAYLENTHISFLRSRRIRWNPFCALGEDAKIRSAFYEKIRILRKDFCVFSKHAERRCAYSPITRKGYLLILLIRSYLSAYSPSTLISFSVFS